MSDLESIGFAQFLRWRVLLACLICVLGTALQAQNGWTKIAPPTNGDLWGVCYGGNQFVAVGTGGTIITSANGTVWNTRASGVSKWLTAVAYGNGTYVVVGDGGTILTSTDAAIWTMRSSSGDRLNGIAYGNGRFVAVGENGTVRSSADAVNWTTTKLPLDSWLRGITYGPDSFLIGGEEGAVCSTRDGLIFRIRGKGISFPTESLFYANGITLAAIGGYTGRLFASDGVQVTTKTPELPVLPAFRGVTKLRSTALAVGEAGMVVSASYDTTNVSSPSIFTLGTANLNAVTAGPTNAVIVGNAGTIFTSTPTPVENPRISAAKLSSSKVYLGGSVTLSTAVDGSPPFTFRWTRQGAVVSGADSDSLILGSLSKSDSEAYTLTVSNSTGSASATLQVPEPTPPPSSVVDGSFRADYGNLDFNGDPEMITGLPNGQTIIRRASWELLRLNSDGSWDTSLKTQRRSVGFSSPGLPLSDGKLLFYTFEYPFAGLKRLNSDGSFDSSFVEAGNFGWPVLLSDGKIVCVSYGYTNSTVTRLNSDGSRDPAFASVTIPIDTPPDGLYSGEKRPLFATDDQGRIYAALTADAANASGYKTGATFIFRLNPDGTLDSSFTRRTLSFTIVRMQWIKGRLCYENPRGPEFGKLTEAGEPDPGFPQINPTTIDAWSVAGDFDRDGGLVVANNSNDAANRGLVRYDATGHIDSSFFEQLDQPTGRIDYLRRLPNGSFLAAGTFTSLNGVPTAGLARLSVPTKDPTTHLANLSIRTTAGSGDQTLIAGFVVAGNSVYRGVLVRGVGPGLVSLGLNSRDVIADPQLTLFKGSAVIARNDDWDASLESTATSLGAFPLTRDSKDAALFSTLAPGAYTVHVTAANNTTGTALIELYDAGTSPTSSADSRLVNISGRAHVGTGDNVLIAGFVLSGNSTKRLLIRAIGPGLKKQGLSDVLSDPELLIYKGAQVILSNDNWNASDAATFAAVGAFTLESGSNDAALVADFPAGVYTAVVRGVGGGTGSALVEIYEVP